MKLIRETVTFELKDGTVTGECVQCGIITTQQTRRQRGFGRTAHCAWSKHETVPAPVNLALRVPGLGFSYAVATEPVPVPNVLPFNPNGE